MERPRSGHPSRRSWARAALCCLDCIFILGGAFWQTETPLKAVPKTAELLQIQSGRKKRCLEREDDDRLKRSGNLNQLMGSNWIQLDGLALAQGSLGSLQSFAPTTSIPSDSEDMPLESWVDMSCSRALLLGSHLRLPVSGVFRIRWQCAKL